MLKGLEEKRYNDDLTYHVLQALRSGERPQTSINAIW